jgi:polysaccharide pyruvyl transferase WcaK-like protein
MKKILIAGWVGSENMGDEAILASLIQRLKLNNFQITAFSVNELKTRDRHKIKSAPFDIYKGPRKFLSAIKKCDLMVIGGGGIIQDQTSIFNTPRYLYKDVLAKLYGKPVVYCGIGAGPVKYKFTKMLIRKIMNRADGIIVRDTESSRVLIDAGVNPKIIEVAFDPVVSLVPIQGYELQKIVNYEFGKLKYKKIIAISLRHWFDINPFIPVSLAQNIGFRQKRGEKKYELLISKIAEAINLLPKKEDNLIVFVPFWFSRDEKVHKDIIAKLSPSVNHHQLKKEYSPQELLGLFTKMDIIIAMRLHASIFAATLGKPFVALSYSSKINNFMDELDLNDNILDIETFKTKDLIKKINELPTENNFKKIISSKMAQARNLEKMNIRIINEIFVKSE